MTYADAADGWYTPDPPVHPLGPCTGQAGACRCLHKFEGHPKYHECAHGLKWTAGVKGVDLVFAHFDITRERNT